MPQGIVKQTGAKVCLEAEDGLDESLLDGIAGGAVTFGKEQVGPGNAETGQAHDAAPDFHVDADSAHTGATASSGITNGTAKASAGVSAGHEVTADLGNGVTGYNRYLVSAQVQAYAGPMGAGAGATVGVGAEAGLKLGDHVEVSAGVSATASAGVAAGIHNYSLVGQANASVDANIHSKATVTSPEFGDGAKVTTNAEAKLGYGAEAGGSATFGASGAYTDYTVGTGFYASIEGDAAIGNSTATTTVSGGVISPGSLSAGMTGGATFEDGKLSLALGQELSVGIGGAKFEVKLDLQLFDSTHKRGSDEEIAAMESAINSFAGTKNEMLTAQWREGLLNDVKAAESDVNATRQKFDEALKVAKDMDAGIAHQYADLSKALSSANAQVDLLKQVSTMPGMAEPYKLAQQGLETAKTNLENWEKGMESPASVALRDQVAQNLVLAEHASQLSQDLANGAKQRYAVSQQMSFLSATIMAESTMKDAENQQVDAHLKVATAESNLKAQKDILSSLEDNYKAQETAAIAQRDIWAKNLTTNPAAATEFAKATQEIARLNNKLAEFEPQRKAVQDAANNLAKTQRAVQGIDAQVEIVRRQMTALHPIWSAQAAVDASYKLSQEVTKTFMERSQAGTVTHLEQSLMQQSALAASRMTELTSDNIKMSNAFNSTLTDIQGSFKHEYDHLNEMVTDRGVVSTVKDVASTVGNTIAGWFS